MKKNRAELLEVINKNIHHISNHDVWVREIKEELSKYQISEGRVENVLSKPELLNDDLRELALFTEQFYMKSGIQDLNIDNWFTKSEMKESRQFDYKLENNLDDIEFPLEIKNVNIVGNGVFVGSLDMCEQLANYPDRALLLAIFEGISGEAFSELLNLQTRNLKEIDEKFYATLTNKDGEQRTIEISDKLFFYLHKADSAEIYYNKNGESESEKSSQSQFVDSPFIFKKLARGRKDGDIDAFYVRRKFQMFKELFGAKYLTAKEIENSGILHMVHEFHQQNGVVTEENWEQIAEQYDTSFIKYQGEDVRNILALKRKANEKIFEDKYGYSLNVLA